MYGICTVYVSFRCATDRKVYNVLYCTHYTVPHCLTQGHSQLTTYEQHCVLYFLVHGMPIFPITKREDSGGYAFYSLFPPCFLPFHFLPSSQEEGRPNHPNRELFLTFFCSPPSPFELPSSSLTTILCLFPQRRRGGGGCFFCLFPPSYSFHFPSSI